MHPEYRSMCPLPAHLITLPHANWRVRCLFYVDNPDASACKLVGDTCGTCIHRACAHPGVCAPGRLRTRASAHPGVCAPGRLRTRASAHPGVCTLVTLSRMNELALQSSTRATLAPRIPLDVPTSGAPDHSTPRKLACALPFLCRQPRCKRVQISG